jgi:DNA-binding NarL/FixJ family response regulator
MGITILLADDHKIFREGLKALLEQENDLTVVGDTDDGSAAVDLSLSLLPDVAILDISMPNLNGIEAARRIVADAPNVKVIVLSMHVDKEYVAEALSAGAQGFIAKTCTSTELVNAIRNVVAGQPYLSPTISTALVGLISTSKEETSNPKIGLSHRELQVLKLLAGGNCTKEVASQLNISTKTVETYRLSLMKKLKITNMVNLVRYAIREGIVDVM